MSKTLESTLKNEGFKPKPYIDPLVLMYPVRYGIPTEDMAIIKKHWDKLTATFGHGLTFLKKEESETVVKMRIESIANELQSQWPEMKYMPELAKGVFTEMAYQLGVAGFMKFKKTRRYAERGEWLHCGDEMLDSEWAREETPERAKKLSGLIKTLAA